MLPSKPLLSTTDLATDAVKENEARCKHESEVLDLRKMFIHLFPVKVPAPANKGFHRRDEHSRIFDSENQPREEHKELGDDPRNEDANTPRRSKKPLYERDFFSETMDDEQQAVNQTPQHEIPRSTVP